MSKVELLVVNYYFIRQMCLLVSNLVLTSFTSPKGSRHIPLDTLNDGDVVQLITFTEYRVIAICSSFPQNSLDDQA